MNTNHLSQLPNKILLLLSLAPDIAKRLKENGSYELIDSFKSYPLVDVIERISPELIIDQVNHHKGVIVIGHQESDNIVLADGSLLSLFTLSDSFPTDYKGFIHIAVCGSSVIKNRLKERCSEATIRTHLYSTQLELQLQVLSHLLKFSEHLNNDNYWSYYEKIRAAYKRKYETLDLAEKENLSSSTLLGKESAYIPKCMKTHCQYWFHFFIHDGNEEDFSEMKKSLHESAAEPISEEDYFTFNRGVHDLKLNEKIKITLTFDSPIICIYGNNQLEYNWEGYLLEFKFLCSVSDDFCGNQFTCNCFFDINIEDRKYPQVQKPITVVAQNPIVPLPEAYKTQRFGKQKLFHSPLSLKTQQKERDAILGQFIFFINKGPWKDESLAPKVEEMVKNILDLGVELDEEDRKLSQHIWAMILKDRSAKTIDLLYSDPKQTDPKKEKIYTKSRGVIIVWMHFVGFFLERGFFEDGLGSSKLSKIFFGEYTLKDELPRYTNIDKGRVLENVKDWSSDYAWYLSKIPPLLKKFCPTIIM